ncbi:Protein madd-4 [Nymphon striatum]|nr:Protein madd-4 [Nymphon striatum]
MMTRSRDKIATAAQLGKQAHGRKLKLTRNTKMSKNPKIFIFETFFKSAYSSVIFQGGPLTVWGGASIFICLSNGRLIQQFILQFQLVKQAHTDMELLPDNRFRNFQNPTSFTISGVVAYFPVILKTIILAQLERGLIRRHFSVIKTKGIENKIKMLNYDFINFNSSVWWPEPVKYPFHGNGYFTSSYHHYHENDILPVPATLPHFVESRRDLPHDVRAGMDIHPLFDRLNFKCIENHGDHILNLMYIYIYIYPHNMGVFGFYKSHIKWEFIFLIIFWMNIIPKSYIYLDLLISFENEKAADIFGLRNLLSYLFCFLQGGDGFTNFGGWSSWTEWSSCSRSCDGGASSMTRKCLFNKGCRYGKLTRYRICNMQPCNDAKNFRDVQCSEYDNKLYNGQFHKWSVAPYNPLRPCALSCSSNRTSVVVEFASQVHDGTRCREGSLGMCISGSCMPVGCDLQLDSTKKIDECGVCGGDGSSCHQSSYHWYETGLSECSVSCGGGNIQSFILHFTKINSFFVYINISLGMQISQPVCRNRITGTQVDDWYCDASSRPRPIVHECNTFPSPIFQNFRWQTESWSECSSSCNGGTQWRAVYCFEGRENGTDFRVDNKECNSERPISERACNLVPCPKWTAEPWSPCSVSCGSGYRTRSVYCKDADGLQNQSCDMTQKPAKRQRCVLTHICSPAQHRKLGNLDERDSILLMGFVAGEWGECSSSNTCGWGFRQRQVRCKVYVEFSGEVILSDDDCSDSVKPLGKDKCFLRPCDDYISNTLDGSTCIFYAYTGVRESITECIRTKDDAVVSPTNCDLSTKPDQLIQTCNNRPCPPRWNISDFTPCTKNCGGGKQFRTVHCIHEVTRGNVLSVSNKLCPQPPPRLERLCGVISCPIKWKTGQWSQRMLMITVKKKKGIKYSSAHSKEQPFCFLIMLAKSLLNIIY